MNAYTQTIKDRQQFSQIKIDVFRKEIATFPVLYGVNDFTIFCAGSYGRLEAEQHSDIDLFFVSRAPKTDHTLSKEKQLRLFGKLIETADNHSFPPFSNDCQYLELHYADDLLLRLGSRDDDYTNSFTIRMLMLLEGNWVYNQDVFRTAQEQIVETYYRDYPDHQATFEPVFMMNDILRFWSTLKINYENKRNQPPNESKEFKVKQKVKNFKLKFSRMTTCQATVASLGSFKAPLKKEEVLDLISKPPTQRLTDIAERLPSTSEKVAAVLEEYAWFLEQTKQSTNELEALFEDKTKTTQMFGRANAYGDLMFDLIMEIDAAIPDKKFLRYIVI